MGLRKSIRRLMDSYARATMGSAPADPTPGIQQVLCGFILCQMVFQLFIDFFYSVLASP
jgi:hypothetical protein